MKHKKLNSSLEYDINKFKYLFLVALSKLNTVDTCKQAHEEIRNLLNNYFIDTELMNFIFNCVTETNEHQKITTKREYIKILCLIAETLGEKLSDHLTKIFQLLNKKLHESEPHLNQVISDTYGVLMEKVIRKLTKSLGFKHTKQILNNLYTNLADHNKNLQIATSMCLIKLIQNCPLEFLISFNEELTKNILDFLRAPHFKSQTHLLEALLSLILSVEKEFKNNVSDVMDYILEIFSKQNNLEWTVKKISIDLIYTLAIILKETIIPYKNQLLVLLQERKCDKIKYVREAALIAINILRNLDANQVDEDYENTQIHAKSYEANRPIKDIFDKYKSPNLNIEQKRYSVGKVHNNQNIYKKYLSEKKYGDEVRNSSYINSPSNQFYESKKFPANNYNKTNPVNGNIHKSNILPSNDLVEDQRNSSKDIIGQQDMDYLFSKMEIIMIQQNKIYENFINFESDIKNEISEMKQKISRMENSMYGAQSLYKKEGKFNNFTYFKSLRTDDKAYETRGYSFEKMKPKENNKSYHTTNNDAYSMMNNQFKNNTNEIMKNLNKFKETNEYIQQKYDFSDINKRNEEEGSEKVKIDQLIIKNDVNEALMTSFNSKDVWMTLQIILDKKIDFQTLRNDILERIFEKIRQIMGKKENFNLLCVWFENCGKIDVLRNNLKIIKIPVLLKEFLNENENNDNFEPNFLANIRKILKVLEKDEN